MSVVIIGGNECMVCQYEKICKDYGCKAKIFAKENWKEKSRFVRILQMGRRTMDEKAQEIKSFQ